MGMKALLLFLAVVFFAQEVSTQTAGAGVWAVELDSDFVNPPSQWVSIQGLSSWQSLSNCFTVELWVNWDGPNGAPWYAIASRHPGNNAPDGMSHFTIGLRPHPLNSSLWNIEAWSGCFNNLGYYLTTSRALAVSSYGFTIKPGEWTHIAFSVGGDGTFLTNAVGQLFAQGILHDSNFWDMNSCGTQFGIPWQANAPDVRLGYYDNQVMDSNPASTNPNSVYGFNGYIDEVAFMSVVRSANDIFRDFFFRYEFTGTENIGLIYYQFNEGPSAGSQMFSKKQNVTATGRIAFVTAGGPIAYLVPDSPALVQPAKELIINQRIPILGKVPSSTLRKKTTFKLLNTPDIPVTNYTIVSASNGLQILISAGDILLMNGNSSITSFPFNLTSNVLDVWANCSDLLCTNVVQAGEPTFTFAIGPSGTTARVKLDVVSSCPSGVLDACGVCNGDNRTCQCVCYHGFRNAYMGFQLFNFTLQTLIAKVDSATEHFNQFLAQLRAIPSGGQPSQPDFAQEIYNSRSFAGCAGQFCSALQGFQSKYTSLLPLPEPTRLPFDACNCDPDPLANS